jgi:hypothetical protein
MSDDIVAATLVEGSLKCWNMPFLGGFITFPDFLNKTLHTSIDFLFNIEITTGKALTCKKGTQLHRDMVYIVFRKGICWYANKLSKQK